LGAPDRPPAEQGDPARRAATLARTYLAARRRRDELLGPGLFADPAWDILLDLFAGQIEGQSISVSSACLAGAVPNTTALGWIVKLEQRGLVTRRPDLKDGRRNFLSLTPEAAAAVEKWLIESLGRH
jgi:Winged helix DNA-binding domain